jgi:hypothetical protein
LRDKLNAFFASPLRTTWLHSAPISVYVRKGFHIGSDGKFRHYLDIANIEVEASCRRQGHFKRFLALCQQIQPYDGIKVENVLADSLYHYLHHLTGEDSHWTERGMDFLWEK